TTSTCPASDLCEAVARAAAGPDSFAPRLIAAIACSGLRLDRVNTGTSGAPRRISGVPCGTRTTAEPIWRDSVNPLTMTTASAGACAGVKVELVTHSSLRPFRLVRSEEHTSELQSRFDLVCRLLLEKK